MKKLGIVISSVLCAFAVACSSAGPDTTSAPPAPPAPTPAAAPSKIVAGSPQTQKDFTIQEWRIYAATDGQPGRIDGLDANGAVLSTETTSIGPNGMHVVVSYDSRVFEETLLNTKLVDQSGDPALAPLLQAPVRDIRLDPKADGQGTCDRDINALGFDAVICVAGALTAVEIIGVFIAAAGCGLTGVQVGVVACACFRVNC